MSNKMAKGRQLKEEGEGRKLRQQMLRPWAVGTVPPHEPCGPGSLGFRAKALKCFFSLPQKKIGFLGISSLNSSDTKAA